MSGRTSIRGILPLAIIAMVVISSCSKPEPRERTSFNEGWKFSLAAGGEEWQGSVDDSGWRLLDLPHDWSIEGEFSDTNPASPGGGALPGGIGWYRKTFRVSDSEKE